ncbi:MAG: DNA polymerase III subunit beta [Clostridia bacterium]|nr:DNA polymerase III subunit beta [Clostridia bacterium]
MKIQFEKSSLLNAISRLQIAVLSRSDSPAMEGILITSDSEKNSVVFNTFDNEKGVRIDMEASVAESGSYIINAQKLMNIVRSLPDEEVLLKVDSGCNVTITSSRSVFKLHSLPGSDFPAQPDLEGEIGFKIKEKEFLDMLSKVLFAAGINHQTKALNGVYVEIKGNNVKFIGCDGFRFAMCDKVCEVHNDSDEELDTNFIIPVKTASELVKVLSQSDDEIQIEGSRKHIVIKVRDMVLFSRTIDQKYISYDRAIPQNSSISVTVNSGDIYSALERALLITEEKIVGAVKSYVRLSFKENVLTISSESINGSIKEEIGIFHTGDDIDIGFNCRYLAETMKACDNDDIEIKLNSPFMSMVFTPINPKEGEKYLFFVLPIRMKEQA